MPQVRLLWCHCQAPGNAAVMPAIRPISPENSTPGQGAYRVQKVQFFAGIFGAESLKLNDFNACAIDQESTS